MSNEGLRISDEKIKEIWEHHTKGEYGGYILNFAHELLDATKSLIEADLLSKVDIPEKLTEELEDIMPCGQSALVDKVLPIVQLYALSVQAQARKEEWAKVNEKVIAERTYACDHCAIRQAIQKEELK